MNTDNENAFPGMYMDYQAQLEQQMREQIETATEAAKLVEGTIEERIVAALKNVYDPEIPVNIYDLGLVYNVDLDEENVAHVEMTLTTPGCPVAQTFPSMVEAVVRNIEGVSDAEVNLVWDPPWTQELLTEAAKLQLGLL